MATADYIDGSFFLCAKTGERPWNGLKFRTTTKTPTLERGEVSIYVTVSLPRALFAKPTLKAAITVPSDRVSAPTIDALVVQNIEDVIRTNLGLEMTITVAEPDS